LLRELHLDRGALDLVVLAGTRIPTYEWMNRVMRDEAYRRRYYGVGLETPRRGLTGRARKLGARLSLLDPAPGKAPLADEERGAPRDVRLRPGRAVPLRVAHARAALPDAPRGNPGPPLRRDRRRRPAPPRGGAPPLGAPRARALRR